MDPSIVLIMVLVAAAIGIAVGLLVMTLIGNRGNQGKSTDSGEAESAPAGSAPVESDLSSQNKKRIEVASFWREPPIGALRVDIGDTTFSSAKDLSDDQRRRLRITMVDLDAWLSAAEPPESSITPQVIDSVPATRPEDRKTGPLVMPATQSMFSPISTSLMDSASRAAATASPVPPGASKSIASQIDEILQEQIAGTALEDRRIRLTEVPSFGVVVKIGLQQYQGIDAVPDPEVRSAITRAVKTWEGRAGK